MSERSIGEKVLRFFGSYGLACVLLILLFLLTLFGTLEQVDHGLYQTQKKYFESWFLLHDLGPLRLPLPGGVLVMGLLALNLLIGGLVRIQKSKRTAGVIVVHVGIVILLAAGLVKMTMSVDGHVTLFEGEQSDDFESYYLWEVALWDASERRELEEVLIPNEALVDLTEGRERSFEHERLPFTITLSHFARNCQPMPKGPMWEAASPTVDGYALRALAPDPTAERNLAGLAARVRTDDGRELEGLLWGAERLPWTFEAGGTTWAATLRHTRYRMPFTLRLEDFIKEDHPGMSMARAFKSDVTKIEDGHEQELRIQMNEPLRHGGLVVFQATWGPQDAGPNTPLYSGFAVVRNPSDYWPIAACIVIGVGLLMAFGQKLLRYVRSQAAKRAALEGGTS